MFSLAECSTSPGSGWVVVYVTGWCDHCVVYCALTPLTTDNTHLIFSVGVKHNCSWPRSQAPPPLHWQANSLLLLLFTVFLHDLVQNLCVLLFTWLWHSVLQTGSLYTIQSVLVSGKNDPSDHRPAVPGQSGLPSADQDQELECRLHLWVVVLHVSVDSISTI